MNYDLAHYGVVGQFYKNSGIYQWADSLMGYRQKENTQASLQAQIDYEQYLRAANERALRDWHKNVPGREIKYPEFSYAGQIYRANTSIARAGFDYATADANYYGNLPYRAAGLYGIGTRVARTL